ncbi:FXYD domain-containing ion transport regulator 11 [Pempheris klunzingeri]|uniref:FXYD domain-containing ion transport regulator 11 n=1 Tax=Pempheris klunzingeri TaxID=3127111 RepID=UPI00397F5557
MSVNHNTNTKIHTSDRAVSWDIHTHSSAPEPSAQVSTAVLKMGRLDVVAIVAVLFTLFMETEANPFVYNYERLRIGGLICSCLLVAGGFSVLLYNRCSRKNKKVEDDSSEI